MSDFMPYLRVDDGGHIWWLRRDAIRLGAGFVVVCDDNQQLEPQLQAPSQRALVNEKTLIGALGDKRSPIPKPLMFERDGLRYVDAAGFLEWLAQYISQTQAAIEFPSELASAVRVALAEAAAERSHPQAERFHSLTLALDGHFDKPLAKLPRSLRNRVQKEFFPMPWDGIAADDRRSVALQLDYQRDPATEAERQAWFDYAVRIEAVETQIKEWERAETPTANELSLKEARLAELRASFDLLKNQQSRVCREYAPARVDDSTQPVRQYPDDDYIAYPKAMQMLSSRLGATPEELAGWIFVGPQQGGLAAYRNANELDPPPRFYFELSMGEDYVSPLMSCWFRRKVLEAFKPSDRYITGAALILRWGRQPGIRPEPFIQAKIAESRLLDIHPTFGGTRGSNADDIHFPPLAAGLFSLNHIERIEVEDGLEPIAPISVQSTETRTILGAISQTPPTTGEDNCAVFRRMNELRPSEIAIAFVGDSQEGGLTGNSMLEITARGVSRRVAFAEFGLVDRRTGTLNKQAAVLVGLAHGAKLAREVPKHAATMKRLRAEFRNSLGVTDNPFEPRPDARGWRALFQLADRRGRADDRARRAAERRTSSFEQLQEQGHQFAAGEVELHGSDDEAERWLAENDPTRSE